MKSISFQDADKLSVGSLVVMRSPDGGHTVYTAVEPGKFMRYTDYSWAASDPDARMKLEDWAESRKVEIYDIYEGKGRVPSKPTMEKALNTWRKNYKSGTMKEAVLSKAASDPIFRRRVIARLLKT